MLTYYILNELLIGYVGGIHFCIKAVSGGGRGSKDKSIWNNTIESYNYEKGESITKSTKEKSDKRGGPIPAGRYVCHYQKSYLDPNTQSYHPHRAELEPIYTTSISAIEKSGLPHNTDRFGFFIHNQGPLGSDGCIVPMDMYDELLIALKDNPRTILEVVNC
jgi:hypothetical protein